MIKAFPYWGRVCRYAHDKRLLFFTWTDRQIARRLYEAEVRK